MNRLQNWLAGALVVAPCIACGAEKPAEKPAKPTATTTKVVDIGPTRGAFAFESSPIYSTDFADTGYGQFPDGWRDLVAKPPSRNWVVDGKGFFRPVLKDYVGLTTIGPQMQDGVIAAKFKKTDDPEVFFGLVTRLRDADNHYVARFGGNNLLELFKVIDGKPESLGKVVALKRYQYPAEWTLSLAAKGPEIAARLVDETGMEVARMDAVDRDLASGVVGINAATFAAVKNVTIGSIGGETGKLVIEPSSVPQYRVLKPLQNVESFNTPADKIQDSYDIIIAGAGTGGTVAAVQAARMGMKVLLLEETDWIGGQMCAAAVSTMDEDGVHGQFPVRERGIYREFNESMVTFYRTLDKDPFNAYYGNPQVEGGYEPKIARAGLYALIDDARKSGTLDLSVRSRVTKTRKEGDNVVGATVEITNDAGTQTRDIASKVLIDATEYGDVIPLTGARYRVGNVTSDKLDMKAPLQDWTWTAQIREYPGGVPEHLKIKSPPPLWEEKQSKRYRNYRLGGMYIWGGAGKGLKGPRQYRVFFAWRGVADSESLLVGELSESRHTQCGLNGGNDSPVTVATIEDLKQRDLDERDQIYLTLGAIYYFQNVLGVPWSLAEDEGFNTPANREKMKRLQIRPDLEPLAVLMPQLPYVRESRRIIGTQTLVAKDLDRFEKAKLFPTSVAMGDYFMDLHRTEEAIETDLDSTDYARGGGPFQVPFFAFIPEKIDGFIPAEKNLSQSRLVSGATRMQPSTMLTGQAAGMIASLSVKQNVQPRQLDPMLVQVALLEAGSTLVQRWYNDVKWGTPLWRATQLLTLYQVMDAPGPLDGKSLPLGSKYAWGSKEPLTGADLATAGAALAKARGVSTQATAPTGDTVSSEQVATYLSAIQPAWKDPATKASFADAQKVTRAEFAILAAGILASGH